MAKSQDHVVRQREQDLSLAFSTYDQNRKYRNPRYDLTGLRWLARAATEFADAIEEHGLPSAESSPATEEDQRLARTAHLWAKSLAGRGDLLLGGKGDTRIQAAVSGKPFTVKRKGRTGEVTIRSWVRQTVKRLESSGLQSQMDKQHAAEQALELKANLLACFDYCKRFYNASKPRKPKPTASEQAQATYSTGVAKAAAAAEAAFNRLLPSAIHYPLTETIKRTASSHLAMVLKDRGVGHEMPNDAAIAVTATVIRKYLAKAVSPDFIRQGASSIASKTRPSALVRQALSHERQDPDHRMRDLVLENQRRIARISAQQKDGAETDP